MLGRDLIRLKYIDIFRKQTARNAGNRDASLFAVKLVNGEKTLQKCTQIQQPKCGDNKAYLERILQPIKLEISI